jgi:glucokinase
LAPPPTLGIDVGGTSVKAALLFGLAAPRLGQSDAYAAPTFETLRAAVAQALAEVGGTEAAIGLRVGLCAPGVVDPATLTVTASINLPSLVGRRLTDLLPSGLAAPTVVTDAHAAAFDLWAANPQQCAGRLLAFSLGTGVGAAVLDEGVPLRVSGASPGHLGHVDVGPIISPGSGGSGSAPALARDGATNTVEAFLGLPALRAAAARTGADVATHLSGLTIDDPAAVALTRIVRIAHAIYRPQHVALLGGVGLRLAHLGPSLYAAVAEGLTSLARPGWTLHFARHGHHAALGAARLAAGAPAVA